MLSGDHLVQHGTQGEQIAARVELFTSRLLRRHVCDGADGCSRASEQMLRGVANRIAAESFLLVLQQLGQSEIENLYDAAIGDENISGLDVGVADSFFVRRVQRVCK